MLNYSPNRTISDQINKILTTTDTKSLIIITEATQKGVVAFRNRLMMDLDEIGMGWNIWTSSLTKTRTTIYKGQFPHQPA